MAVGSGGTLEVAEEQQVAVVMLYNVDGNGRDAPLLPELQGWEVRWQQPPQRKGCDI